MKKIKVRDFTREDIEVFAGGEIAQGWQDTHEKHRLRLVDRDAGLCVTLTCEYDGEPAGYVSLYHAAKTGPFIGLPEIVDFNVLEHFRRRGIGTFLLNAAEELAAKSSREVTLAVGLHSGYGAAQRMYIKCGYIPDGSGAWYADKRATPYASYALDDELVLYMKKVLR